MFFILICLILNTTHRASERSVGFEHAGIAAKEVEVARVRVNAANRTAPIVAVGTDTDERTRAVEAVARQGQL